MVPIPAILNGIMTVLTFLEGIIEQVAPVVTKFLETKANANRPTIDPNCEMPRCGIHPYYCHEGALSQACIQRAMTAEYRHVTQPSVMLPKRKNNDDDDEDDNGNNSKSMSPGGTIILVFVVVVALAIIGFVIIRLRQSTSRYNDERNYDDRKSSIGSV